MMIEPKTVWHFGYSLAILPALLIGVAPDTVQAADFITGHVQTISGQGLAGVVVRAQYYKEGIIPPPEYTEVVTNANGYYSIKEDPTSKYRVTPFSRNHQFTPESQIVDLRNGSQSNIDFIATLTEAGDIFDGLQPRPLPYPLTLSGMVSGVYDSEGFPYLESLGFSYITFSTDGTFEAWNADRKILPMYTPSGFADVEGNESVFYTGIYAYENGMIIADGTRSDGWDNHLAFTLDVTGSMNVTGGRFYDPVAIDSKSGSMRYFSFSEISSNAPLVTIALYQYEGERTGRPVANTLVELLIDHHYYSNQLGKLVTEQMYSGAAYTAVDGLVSFGKIGDLPSLVYSQQGYRVYVSVEGRHFYPVTDRFLGFMHGQHTFYSSTRLKLEWNVMPIEEQFPSAVNLGGGWWWEGDLGYLAASGDWMYRYPLDRWYYPLPGQCWDSEIWIYDHHNASWTYSRKDWYPSVYYSRWNTWVYNGFNY